MGPRPEASSEETVTIRLEQIKACCFRLEHPFSPSEMIVVYLRSLRRKSGSPQRSLAVPAPQFGAYRDSSGSGFGPCCNSSSQTRTMVHAPSTVANMLLI